MKTIYIKRNDLFKNINMVLFNDINEIDENFTEDNMSLYETTCDTCKGDGEVNDIKCEECYGEGRFEREVYQMFLTDINKDDYTFDRLASYGIGLGYSEKLDKYLLPIYDFGTSWSMFSYSKEVPDDYILAHDETTERQTVY